MTLILLKNIGLLETLKSPNYQLTSSIFISLPPITTLRKEKSSCRPGDHPELDSSTLLCEAQHRLYQQLVGKSEWAV